MSDKEPIHFECTACGACCKTAPRLTFFDLLNLSDEFIFQAKHFSLLSTSKEPLPKERIYHLERLAHTVIMEEQKMVMFYWMSLGVIQKPSQKTCPKLENNLCSIYNKRPINCRNMPAYIAYPPAMQENVITFYKNNVTFKCDFSEDAPLYMKDGEFVDSDVEAIYYNELDQTRTFTDRYLAYINMTPNALNSHFQNAVKALLSKTEMTTDLITPMCVMVIEGWAEPEQMDNVLRNQIKLIEKDVEVSKKNKFKEDLKTVRFYENMLKIYDKALTQKLFHNLNASGITF